MSKSKTILFYLKIIIFCAVNLVNNDEIKLVSSVIFIFFSSTLKIKWIKLKRVSKNDFS